MSEYKVKYIYHWDDMIKQKLTAFNDNIEVTIEPITIEDMMQDNIIELEDVIIS